MTAPHTVSISLIEEIRRLREQPAPQNAAPPPDREKD